ncbi:GAF domain-containing protein [Microbacter margulisiae]|uniref:GAF domain-containing protein n=1 Tax=Microbacter margulisiae TaxID=1350067 RepID=A0A7W5DPE5_9PORP|nr:GAF domain-containing protein [Microbacter margulisiae]MBB3186581.1 GAF domain-containing protein [Microbacter margulisiae]
MAETLQILQNVDKEEQYLSLLPQLGALVEYEDDLIANFANIASALKETFQFFWVGFYRVVNNVLILGPFQGPIACTRIAFGKGVCGKAWQQAASIIVPDVDQFPGHIACSSLSKSEIVIPLIINNIVIAILDIDSTKLNDFDEIDRYYLDKIVNLLGY